MKKVAVQSFLALRPKQWAKNILLFVAPFSAGVSFVSDAFPLIAGFVAFSIASSIGYILNDINDVEIDRKHPKKKFRPFASGILSLKFGFALISILFIVLAALLLTMPTSFRIILLFYILNTNLYTYYFKSIPVLEMFLVAFGFVLRLIAGAFLISLPISEWFLIVGGFGALFVVSAKRLAELKQSRTRAVRKVITEYSADFLYSSTSVSVAVCLAGYSFWAFDQTSGAIWYQISLLPFVMGLFRYLWLSERNVVEAPEDAILDDKPLLLLSLCLILVLSVAVYL